MDLEGIMLSEINQAEKDKKHGFTYMWNLKKLNKQTQQNKHKYRDQMNGYLKGEGGEMSEKGR